MVGADFSFYSQERKVNQQFPTVILIRAIAGGQVWSEIEQIVMHAHSKILQLQQNIGDRGYPPSS